MGRLSADARIVCALHLPSRSMASQSRTSIEDATGDGPSGRRREHMIISILLGYNEDLMSHQFMEFDTTHLLPHEVQISCIGFMVI